MSLGEVTLKILRMVETESGLPVQVEPDPNLPGSLMARVVMARGSVPFHRVLYRPNVEAPPDYLICQQAGFILRHFQTPPAQRCDLISARAGRDAIDRLVRAHPIAQTIPAHALPELTRIYLENLVTHLRSIPIGLRVDRWLMRECPELHALQKAAILRQLQDSIATLAPQHRQMTPSQIFDATHAISAAFAAFWAEALHQPQLALPFKTTGYHQHGGELLGLLESIPERPENDRALVDAWAEKLGLASWMQWTPYSAPIPP